MGIAKPALLMGGEQIVGTSYLNILFILLTLVKAYYIVVFHAPEVRAGNLIWTIALPAVILIPYLTFIVLTEGNYINFMLN